MIRIPGIEAPHTWQPADGDPFRFGGVDPASRGSWPNIRLLAIDGRHAKPDRENKADPATGRMGEINRRSLARGKTEAWRGLVRGRTLAEVRDGVDELLAAFGENDDGVMTIHQPASYPGLPDLTYTATVLACSAPDEQTFGPDRTETGGWERQFTLGLRLPDPRYYETAEQTEDFSGFVTAGGMVLPVALPAPIVGGSVPVGTVTVHNYGGAPAEPVIDLPGPAIGPEAVNESVGAKLSFPALSLAAGQFLRIDFRTRQVLLNGVDDARQYWDRRRSSWWDAGMPGLKRGVNVLRYRGVSVTPDQQATVRWRNASYG